MVKLSRSCSFSTEKIGNQGIQIIYKSCLQRLASKTLLSTIKAPSNAALQTARFQRVWIVWDTTGIKWDSQESKRTPSNVSYEELKNEEKIQQLPSDIKKVISQKKSSMFSNITKRKIPMGSRLKKTFLPQKEALRPKLSKMQWATL